VTGDAGEGVVLVTILSVKERRALREVVYEEEANENELDAIFKDKGMVVR